MAEEREVLLRRILDDIAEKQHYDNYELQVKGLPPTGANFTSQLFHSTIAAPNKKDLKLFAKVSVVGEKLRAQWPANLFAVESHIYKKILNIYKQLEEDNMVPEEDRLITPYYYGGSETYLEEVLVLEDLSTQGYTTHDRLMPVDWKYASKVVEQLAKLHALSVAYKEKYPKSFEEDFNILEKKIPKENGIDLMFEQLFKSVLEKIDDKYKERLRQFLSEYSGVEKIMTMTLPFKQPMLVHTDFRVSNLMHKVDENGQLKVVIVDYQTMCVGNPSIDLLYFIFTGTDAEFRRKHYQQLIDHYYEQLSLALARLHMNADEHVPRKDFEEEFKLMSPFGLLIAIMVLPIVTVDIEHVQEDNEGLETMSNMLQNTNQMAVNRIHEVVTDYVRWGLL